VTGSSGAQEHGLGSGLLRCLVWARRHLLSCLDQSEITWESSTDVIRAELYIALVGIG